MKHTPGSKADAEAIGLPPRTFFYTIDQIAYCLAISEREVKRKMLHFEGRSPGLCPRDKMRAVNIMPEGEKPEWRVSDSSFTGYLKRRRIKFYTRGYA